MDELEQAKHLLAIGDKAYVFLKEGYDGLNHTIDEIREYLRPIKGKVSDDIFAIIAGAKRNAEVDQVGEAVSGEHADSGGTGPSA